MRSSNQWRHMLRNHLRRREFIAMLGSAAAAWPLTARAQQSAMPVIGFLSGTPREPATSLVVAAKRATTTIPIVFISGVDPVTSGLVESFNRPSGNATGVYILTTSLEAKRLEMLHQAVPSVAMIGVLVNPNFSDAEGQLTDLRDASRILGVELLVLKVTGESGFAGVFATLVERRIGALLVAMDPFLYAHGDQLVALAARRAIPAMFGFSEFALAGALMSYGTNLTEAYRQVGIYTGRILKGEKPADLPVQQSTKVELVLNLKTAKALGLTFPIALLGRADQVIE
jgi:putative tryptophan/tyrosine transport system substrate-binding protein